MFDFGPLAAQDDPNILEYFQKSEQIEELVISTNKQKNLFFVARPGVGKTALVRWLEKGDHNRNVIPIKAENVRIIIENDETANPEDHRLLMGFELYTGFILEVMKWKILSDDLQNECVGVLTKKWLESLKGFFKDRFEGISIVGTGFSLKTAERRQYLQEIRRDKKVETAAEIISKIANEQKNILVVVDNPEFIVGQGLEDVSRDNAIRIGAFLSILNQLHSLGIQVIVFIKEHILRSIIINYRDFAHFEDRVSGLTWTEDDLIDLINLRITKRFNLDWKDVFEINQTEFKKEIIPYLVNGPRDLLTICNSAGEKSKIISRADLRRSIDATKRRKWEDLSTQYNAQWPRIDQLARVVIDLIKEHHRAPITRKEFTTLFNAAFQNPSTELHFLRLQEDWIGTVKWSNPSIDEILFFIGCLGYIKNNQKFYPWEGRSLEGFRMAEKIFISPIFE